MQLVIRDSRTFEIQTLQATERRALPAQSGEVVPHRRTRGGIPERLVQIPMPSVWMVKAKGEAAKIPKPRQGDRSRLSEVPHHELQISKRVTIPVQNRSDGVVLMADDLFLRSRFVPGESDGYAVYAAPSRRGFQEGDHAAQVGVKHSEL